MTTMGLDKGNNFFYDIRPIILGLQIWHWKAEITFSVVVIENITVVKKKKKELQKTTLI